MQLYFIRHAQSENNALWARTQSFKGRIPDPGLTDLGHQQAQILAEFLRNEDRAGADHDVDLLNRHGYRFTHLYCSLLRRAVDTAAYLAEALELSLVAWPDLHEEGGMFNYHEDTGEPIGLPGPDRAYFAKHCPQLVLPDGLGDQGWWNRPFESADQVTVRARRVWQELLIRHGGKDDRVAVVCHGAFTNRLLAIMLDLPLRSGAAGEPDPVWFRFHNTGITRIDWSVEQTRVTYANRIDFLPTDLIT